MLEMEIWDVSRCHSAPWWVEITLSFSSDKTWPFLEIVHMRSLQFCHWSRSNLTIRIQVVIHKQMTGCSGLHRWGWEWNRNQTWVLLAQLRVLTLRCNKLLSKVFHLQWIILSILHSLIIELTERIPIQQICDCTEISLHKKGVPETSVWQSYVRLRKTSTVSAMASMSMYQLLNLLSRP
jgi:hypothetical protein